MDLDSVKIYSRRMAKYHHGDLPAALRSATAELIAENGPSGFSLREVARRAGVSHAAPAHHFGDAEGLLTSVAAEGFARLADAGEEAGDHVDEAVERLRRIGASYVRVARENPGHFAVMIQSDLVCSDDPILLEHSLRAYVALQRAIELVRHQLNPELDVEVAATFCWASIQGLVSLSPKLDDVAADTGTKTTPLDALIDEFARIMVEGMAAR